MRRIIYCQIVLLLTMVFFSCEEEFICERGNGPVEEMDLELGEIRSINVSEGIRVYISQGLEQSVKVNGQRNVIDLINKKVKNGEWKINFTHCVRRHEDVTIQLTLRSISSIKVSGSGEVIVEDAFNGEDINLDISGSGKINGAFEANSIKSEVSGSGEIEVYGSTYNSEVKISGSGDFKGFDLITKNTKIKISGSGNAEVFTQENLNAEISGSGDVRYMGNPAVNSKINGSGSIQKVN